MDIIKAFSRRSLLWLLFFMLLLLAIINLAIYFGAQYLFSVVSLDIIEAAASRTPALQSAIAEASPFIHWVSLLFLPVTIGLFFIFALIQWLVVRGALVRVIRKAGIQRQQKVETGDKKKARAAGEEDDAATRKALQEQQQRYYLHLLSVLQRDGRLVDFLEEDLAPYDDSQIGAAVRSIHENCRKTLKKYLAPKSVMDENEGEQVTVPANFDPGTIKLTGNVAGEPPFTGVLRHRGWRAAKIELPVLSGSTDTRIIAPAEVEIP